MIVDVGRLDVVGPGADRPGIVERDPAILAVDQAAEIALAHRIGPNRRCRGAGLPLAQLFPGGEEEGSVLAVVDLGKIHRAAERGAEFVAHQMRRLGERVLALARDAEAAVAAGFEDRTVDIVGAARVIMMALAGRVELGAGYRRLDAEFLDRVESRAGGTESRRYCGPAGSRRPARSPWRNRAGRRPWAGWRCLPGPGTAIVSSVWMLRPFSGSCSMRARSTTVATVGLLVDSKRRHIARDGNLFGGPPTSRETVITARCPATRVALPSHFCIPGTVTVRR